MHAEEAEVVSGAEARDDEFLLSDGGGGFFDDVGNIVEVFLTADAGAANRAVEGEFTFVSGLDGGNGAIGRFRDGEKLLEAGVFGEGEVEVVAHHEKEAIVAREFLGAENGLAVAEGFALFNEGDLIKVIGDGRREVALGAGCNDDGSGLDAAGEDFIEKECGDSLGFAAWANKSLQREMLLLGTGCCDDRFLNLHGMSRECK